MSPLIGARPTFRKLEVLVIGSMLIAVPLIAVRITSHTGNELEAMRISIDLEHSLRKARDIARTNKVVVTVATRPAIGKEPAGYVIQEKHRIIDAIKLPPGISVIGSVTFDKSGVPERRSFFLITRGMTNVSVNVDAQGIISAK